MAFAFHLPHRHSTKDTPKRTPEQEQLRRDRVTLAVMLLVLAAFFGLIVWLSMLDGGANNVDFDYYPMM
jgi:hypothetical protein